MENDKSVKFYLQMKELSDFLGRFLDARPSYDELGFDMFACDIYETLKGVHQTAADKWKEFSSANLTEKECEQLSVLPNDITLSSSDILVYVFEAETLLHLSKITKGDVDVFDCVKITEYRQEEEWTRNRSDICLLPKPYTDMAEKQLTNVCIKKMYKPKHCKYAILDTSGLAEKLAG